MSIPQKTIDQIKANAESYTKMFKHGAEYRKPAYIDGATEWADKATGLIAALQEIRKEVPNESWFAKKIDNALAKYKEVSNG